MSLASVGHVNPQSSAAFYTILQKPSVFSKVTRILSKSISPVGQCLSPALRSVFSLLVCFCLSATVRIRCFVKRVSVCLASVGHVNPQSSAGSHACCKTRDFLRAAPVICFSPSN